ADHDGHQTDDRQGIDARLGDLPGDRRQTQLVRMNERVAERACRTADESDYVERVVPHLVPTLADVDHPFAPTGEGPLLWQWLELEASDEIEQPLVLRANAGQFDAVRGKLAKKQ